MDYHHRIETLTGEVETLTHAREGDHDRIRKLERELDSKEHMFLRSQEGYNKLKLEWEELDSHYKAQYTTIHHGEDEIQRVLLDATGLRETISHLERGSGVFHLQLEQKDAIIKTLYYEIHGHKT